MREGTIPLTNIRGGFLFVSLIGDPALFRMRPMFNIALRKKRAASFRQQLEEDCRELESYRGQ